MTIKLPEPAGKVAYEAADQWSTDWISSEDAYTHAQLVQAVKDALEEVLNCYSPDDTATDYQNKIIGMREKVK